MELAAAIDAYMVDNDATQQDVADAIGVNQGTVSRWLKNTGTPSRARYQALAELLDLSVADIGAMVATSTEPERLRRVEQELASTRSEVAELRQLVAELAARLP